ncbi:hypothetical protein DMH04_10580 [Kibdelosporangium aridum]|uniref:Uncharacterized protein n=1 Tax=Kibdelosporangium aridum TaxID=2030 RepID=A0A428ZHC8_KIBAR|nr:hypothetical protein DMH04_10580 [Kibdelosporangium aridum]
MAGSVEDQSPAAYRSRTVGTLPLPLSVAGHEGSTVIVGLNGLRLLRDSAWQPARRDTSPRRPMTREGIRQPAPGCQRSSSGPGWECRHWWWGC